MGIERIGRKAPSGISVGTLVVLIGAALGCLYQVMLLLPVPLGHDQSWYLYASQQVLSGVTLYGPHLSETNPPLIMWLSVIPVLVAHAMHVSPVIALRMVVIALILLSTIWNLRFLHWRHPAANSVFLIFAACAIAFVEFDIWPLDFGQREQLLVILVLPYIFAVTSGVVTHLSLGERCALGVAAGIAICCKPQHALIIVCFEIFLALYIRSIRRMIAPEFLALILTGGAYVASIRLLTPLYLQKTLPLLFETYWAYGQQSALALARTQGKLILIALLVFTACLVFRRHLSNAATPMGLVICGLAASVAFDIQRTGWPYQRYPARAFVMLAAFYCLLDLLLPVLDRGREAPRLRIRNALIIAGLTVIPICWLAVHFYKPPAKSQSPLDNLLASYSPHTNVSILSTNVYEFSRVFDHGLTWSSRFPALWMLPAIIQNEQSPTSLPKSAKTIAPAELSRLADLQRSQTAEDLDYWRPSVILIARCTVKDPCQALEGRNFDMLAWFLQSPAFTGVWSHYQRQQSLSAYDVYTRTR